MALFIYAGYDGPDGAEKRPGLRPNHLDHLSQLDADGRILFAGPLKDAQGAPCGSLIVMEAKDLAEARAIADNDPYTIGGVFERVDVFESLQVFPKTVTD